MGLSGSWITPSATRGLDRLARAIFVVTTAVAVVLSLSLGGLRAMMAAPVILVVGFAITYVWGGSQDQRPARWYGTPIYRDYNRFNGLEVVCGCVCLLVMALIPYFPRACTALIARNFRRCAIEFDAATRRLKITSTYLGIITRMVIDYPVQECTACGVIKHPRSDEWHLYVDRWARYEFAVNLYSRDDVNALAGQMSAMTGIARRDIVL